MSTPLDLRAVIPSRQPLRCVVSDEEVYEVRVDVLHSHGSAGNVSQLAVFQSVDGERSWQQVRFRRNWWQQWWAIFNGGLGGSCWPPAGEDVRDAYVKNGKLSISYCNLRDHGPNGQSYVWEMQYDQMADRWNLSLLEEIAYGGR